MTPITQAILFDLEDTLLDRQATRKSFLVVQWQTFLDELIDVPARRFVETVNACFWEEPEAPAEAYRSAMARLHLPLHLGDVLEQDRLQQSGGQPRLFPGTLDILRDLSRHFRLGLVSNGRENDHLRILQASGMKCYFQSIVISENKGQPKPAPDLFLRCLHNLGVSPVGSVMVGDQLEEDILPAVALGMRAVWVHHRRQDRPDICKKAEVIDDLRDLPYALRNAANTPAG